MNITILFDLDGTLLDTLDDLADSVNFALESSGLPRRSLDEIRSFVGNGIKNLVHRAVPDGCDAEAEGEIFSLFKQHYAINCAVKTAPYPDIEALLGRLKAEGYMLGVVSNKNDTNVKKLINAYFPGVFDVICGERENVRRKPAPDLVLACMEELGCGKSETVYVGDSDVDSLTAANAGIKCILVSWGFRDRSYLKEKCADPIVDSVAELHESISECFALSKTSNNRNSQNI